MPPRHKGKPGEGQIVMDYLWGYSNPEPERIQSEESHEPAGPDSASVLSGLPAERVRGHSEPGRVLSPVGGGAAGGRDSGSGRDRGTGPTGAGVSGEGGPIERSHDAGPRVDPERAALQPRAGGAGGRGGDAGSGTPTRPRRDQGPDENSVRVDEPAPLQQAPDLVEEAAQASAAEPWRVDSAGQPTPSGALARIEANLAALEVVKNLEGQKRAATREEQAVLAQWSSWGAVPQIFNENTRYAEQRTRLRALLSDSEWNAASRTTINAHYTQPSYVAAMWQGLVGLGFTEGTVLEPGCGSGTFISLAPPGAHMLGVELDPITAAITRHLNPTADIRTESFADTRLSRQVDAVVGNVPFADVRLHDPVYNMAKLTMHNHFIAKSLALTKPGGIVAVLTSKYTMDSKNPAARREIAQLGELVGAVRFPTGAHARTAGTDVITDLLVLRRRTEPAPETPANWERATGVMLNDHEILVNNYFQENSAQVLGLMAMRKGQFGPELEVSGPVPTPENLLAAVQRVVTHGQNKGLTWSQAPGETITTRESMAAKSH
jgi:SAM-dependent methyltransferase